MPVMKLKGTEVTTFNIPLITFAAYRDPKGTVYMGADSGIWEMNNAGPRYLTALPIYPNFSVEAITKDFHDTFWVSLEIEGGLYTWSDGRWSKSAIVGRQRIPSRVARPDAPQVRRDGCART